MLDLTPIFCLAKYRELFIGHIAPDIFTMLRDSVNKGVALGNDRFKYEIESLTGRRVSLLKRGPKPSRDAEGVLDDQGFLLWPQIF